MRTTLLLSFVVFSSAVGCAGQNHHFVRDTYAKEMNCADDKVIVLNYPGRDKRRGSEWQAYGCGQRRACLDNSDKGRWECRWPDDLQAAGAQLKLLTACPTAQMQPVAYNEAKKGPTLDDSGGDWEWPGGSWRVDVCGKPFMCMVSAEGGQPNCQPAPDLTSAPPPPPPSR